MSVYPPNPVNTLGQKRDHNIDQHIARKARYLFGKSHIPEIKIDNVYFVLASDNLVKIGHTTNIQRRVSNLSVLHPSFMLLGTVSNHTEKEVHRTFSDFKVKGEWYRYDGSMIDYINANKN